MKCLKIIILAALVAVANTQAMKMTDADRTELLIALAAKKEVAQQASQLAGKEIPERMARKYRDAQYTINKYIKNPEALKKIKEMDATITKTIKGAKVALQATELAAAKLPQRNITTLPTAGGPAPRRPLPPIPTTEPTLKDVYDSTTQTFKPQGILAVRDQLQKINPNIDIETLKRYIKDTITGFFKMQSKGAALSPELTQQIDSAISDALAKETMQKYQKKPKVDPETLSLISEIEALLQKPNKPDPLTWSAITKRKIKQLMEKYSAKGEEFKKQYMVISGDKIF